MSMYQCNRSPQRGPTAFHSESAGSHQSRLHRVCIWYGRGAGGAPEALSCVVCLVHPLVMEAHTALLLAEVLCFAQLLSFSEALPSASVDCEDSPTHVLPDLSQISRLGEAARGTNLSVHGQNPASSSASLYYEALVHVWSPRTA